MAFQMHPTHSLLILLVLVGIVTTRGRAETAERFTYRSYVQSEHVRVCAKSQDAGCHESFDKLARIAARLDELEKVAEQLENSGETERALELRRLILADVIMLDVSLDLVIMSYPQDRGSSAPSNL
jgi:hypothetical protein